MVLVCVYVRPAHPAAGGVSFPSSEHLYLLVLFLVRSTHASRPNGSVSSPEEAASGPS